MVAIKTALKPSLAHNLSITSQALLPTAPWASAAEGRGNRVPFEFLYIGTDIENNGLKGY